MTVFAVFCSWCCIKHTLASLFGLVKAACWKDFWKAELSAEIFLWQKSFLHSVNMLYVGFLGILIAVLLLFLITHSNILRSINAYSFVILLNFKEVLKDTTHLILSKERASPLLTVQLFAIKLSAGWQIFFRLLLWLHFYSCLLFF